MPYGVVSQSQGSERPAKRRRLSNRSSSRMVVKVPRAIRTRGTPAGYYEIPVRIYRKIYWNASTGFYNTDQTTGAYSGVTGYRGLSLACLHDTAYAFIGEGSTSATMQNTIGNAADLGTVFDQVKIVKTSFEFKFTNDVPAANAAASDLPEFFVFQDTSDCIPPTSRVEILQYQRCKNITAATGKRLKVSVTPTIELAANTTSTDASATSAGSVVQPAPYMSTGGSNTVQLRQLKCWLDVSSGSTNNSFGYLHIIETQIRRYKMTK